MTPYEEMICNIHAQHIMLVIHDLEQVEKDHKKGLISMYEFQEIKQQADQAIKQLYKHLFNT